MDTHPPILLTLDMDRKLNLKPVDHLPPPLPHRPQRTVPLAVQSRKHAGSFPPSIYSASSLAMISFKGPTALPVRIVTKHPHLTCSFTKCDRISSMIATEVGIPAPPQGTGTGCSANTTRASNWQAENDIDAEHHRAATMAREQPWSRRR